MAEGWHLKPLHRLIVLSRAYQTSSALEADAGQGDQKLALFGRWRQRRLEAEAVRDSMLAVSGQLNSAHGGPSVFPPLPRAVLEGQSRPGSGWGNSSPLQAARRSIYVFCKRSLAVPELELLDTPDTTSSCEQRPLSTTAPAGVDVSQWRFRARTGGELGGSTAARSGRGAGGSGAPRLHVGPMSAAARR